MILLIRFFLISLIIYLIARSFRRMMEGTDNGTRSHESEKKSEKTAKGVPKELGEYIDYEEVDKE